MRDAASTPANLPGRPCCAHCGSSDLAAHAKCIEVLIGNRTWQIRQVPALHCKACGETFVRKSVASELHELRHRIFQMDGFWRQVAMPVIDFPRASPERQLPMGRRAARS